MKNDTQTVKKQEIINEVDVDPFFGWRIQRQESWYWSSALVVLPTVMEFNDKLKDIYQFGVATGMGLRHIAHTIKEQNLPEVNAYHGFDVFTGMPEEENEPVFELNWSGGVFNELERRGVNSITDVINLLYTEWESENTAPLYIYSGLYKDSLTMLSEQKQQIEENMKPALVVHIDCDLYTSTIEALDFMYKHNLIQGGTVIIYDDWGGTKNWQQAHSGESRAHKEMTIKYNVSYDQCFQFGLSHPGNNCPENIQRAYIVSSVGIEPTLDSEINGTIIGSIANTKVDVNSGVPYTPQPWPKGY